MVKSLVAAFARLNGVQYMARQRLLPHVVPNSRRLMWALGWAMLSSSVVKIQPEWQCCCFELSDEFAY